MLKNKKILKILKIQREEKDFVFIGEEITFLNDLYQFPIKSSFLNMFLCTSLKTGETNSFGKSSIERKVGYLKLQNSHYFFGLHKI